MKATTLKNKLAKMNIEIRFNDSNENYTQLRFEINGNLCEVDTFSDSDEISSICVIGEYNECSQETERRFFSSFKKLLVKCGVK